MRIVPSRLREVVIDELAPLVTTIDVATAITKMKDADIEDVCGRVLMNFNRSPVGQALVGLGMCLAINRATGTDKILKAMADPKLGYGFEITPADIRRCIVDWPLKLRNTIILCMAHMTEEQMESASKTAMELCSTLPHEHLLIGTLFGMAFTIDRIRAEVATARARGKTLSLAEQLGSGVIEVVVPSKNIRKVLRDRARKARVN
jgi:hypothetical protein